MALEEELKRLRGTPLADMVENDPAVKLMCGAGHQIQDASKFMLSDFVILPFFGM